MAGSRFSDVEFDALCEWVDQQGCKTIIIENHDLFDLAWAVIDELVLGERYIRICTPEQYAAIVAPCVLFMQTVNHDLIQFDTPTVIMHGENLGAYSLGMDGPVAWHRDMDGVYYRHIGQ